MVVTKMQCICMGAHDICFPFYEETKLRIMNWILRRYIAESKITTENLRTMSHVNNLQNDSYEGGKYVPMVFFFFFLFLNSLFRLQLHQIMSGFLRSSSGWVW